MVQDGKERRSIRWSRRLARSRFYLVMSALFATIIVVGFTPTFYLRAYLLPPQLFGRHQVDLPAHLYVHGAFFTAWFLLVVVQPSLVALGKIRLHRWLGVLGVGLMAGATIGTVVTLALVDVGLVDELPTRRFDASLWSAVSFATCVTLGVWHRRTPAVHKRLMLIASIPMLPFALTRVIDLSEYYGVALPRLIGIGIPMMLLAVIVGRDIVTERRVHRGTVYGLVAMYGVSLPLVIIIVRSGAWAALVRLFV